MVAAKNARALAGAVARGETYIQLPAGEVELEVSLVVEGPVVLRATEGTVLVGPTNGPVLAARGDLTIEGVEIRARARGPAVRVEKGTTRMVRCTVTGSQRMLGMVGLAATLEEEIAARLHKKKKKRKIEEPAETTGVEVGGEGRVVLEACELRDHPGAGLRSIEGGSVHAVESRFAQSRIALSHESTGEIRMERCKVEDNREGGVEVSAGDAVIADSFASGNVSPGFSVSGSAQAHLARNRSTANKYIGIRVNGGEATLEDNDCSGHELAGIAVFDGRATLRGNRSHENQHGVLVRAGEVALERNSCHGNATSGLMCDGGGRVLAREDRFEHNGVFGVIVEGVAEVKLTRCVIARNVGGLFLRVREVAELVDCDVRDNPKAEIVTAADLPSSDDDDDDDDDLEIDLDGDETFLGKWLDDRIEARAEEIGAGDVRPPLGVLEAVARAAAPNAVTLGKGKVKTLADAVEAVSPGGTIFVPAGVHRQAAVISTKKPFRLEGVGATESVLVFVKATDDCMILEGPGPWRLEGFSLLAEYTKKDKACGDLVLATEGAVVEAVGCLFAGAKAQHKPGGVVSGGCAVRAYERAKVRLERCHLAVAEWAAGAHLGASLELERCLVYVAARGVMVTDASAKLTDTLIRGCGFSVRAYDAAARLELTRCRLHDSAATSAFAEVGCIRLIECKITQSGGHGVSCAAQGTIEASRCHVARSYRSGFWIEGEARLEDDLVERSWAHGVELHETSRGTVARCRFVKNELFGLFRHEKSEVVLEGNVFERNRRGEEGTFGTLARELERGLPRGVALPASLAKLSLFQETHGTLLGETRLEPGPLAGWPGLEDRFGVFGRGPDGSVLAVWLDPKARDAATAPVVYLDSENAESFVLAASIEQFLSILACGYDDLAHVRAEPDFDDDDALAKLQGFLEHNLGVQPADDVAAILDAAAKKHRGLRALLLGQH